MDYKVLLLNSPKVLEQLILDVKNHTEDQNMLLNLKKKKTKTVLIDKRNVNQKSQSTMMKLKMLQILNTSAS